MTISICKLETPFAFGLFMPSHRKMSYSLICLRMATAVVVSGFSVVLPGFGTALPLPANVLWKATSLIRQVGMLVVEWPNFASNLP